MNSLKLYLVFTALFWVFALYTVLSYVNKSYAIEVIPSRHIHAVVMLYIIYYGLHVVFFSWFLSKRWSYRIIAGFGCCILLSTLFPIMNLIIQDLMPRYDLQLFRDDVSYDEVRFHRRLISAYIFVVVSALMTIIIALFIYKRRDYNLQMKELQTLQKKLIGKDIKTHFIKNLLSTNFGLILLQSKPEQKRNIHNTIALLAYFMRIESKNENLVSLDEEFKELQRFIELLQQYYGEFSVKWDGKIPCVNLLVPLGLLLLPLENILKYAKISSFYPILIEVKKQEFEWMLTYKSVIDKAKVKRNKGSGTGISNMNKLIDLLELSIDIETMEKEEMYVFSIKIKCI